MSFREILVKKNVNENKSYITAFFTVAVASLFFIIFFSNELTLNFSSSIWYLMILKSLILTLAFLTLFKAVQALPVNVVTPLKNLSTVTIALLGFIILSEKLNPFQYLGICVIVASAYLMEINPKTHKFEKLPSEVFYIFLWMGLVAVLPIMDKVILSSVNIYNAWFYPIVFCTIQLFLLIAFQREIHLVKNQIKRNYLILASIGIFFLADTMLWFAALSKPAVLVSLAVPIRRISGLFTSLIGGKIYHEGHYIYRSLIALLMIVGVFMVSGAII